MMKNGSKFVSSVLAEFRLKRQVIICLMEECDGMNKHIVKEKKMFWS